MSGGNPHIAEIVVEGYSPRYVRAAKRLLGTEGGYVNDRADRGGATKYGVSLRFLSAEGAFDADYDGKPDFDLDLDGDIDGQDIRLLTAGDALFLYHRCFWKRLDAESFIAPIGEMMFDQAVNGGLVAARKLLQRAINDCLLKLKLSAPIAVDGVLGTATHEAFDRVLRYPALGFSALVLAYRAESKDRYSQIAAEYPSQRRFLDGWLARADRLGAD